VRACVRSVDRAVRTHRYLYGASFFSATARDAVYNSSAGGHLNNAHCVPRAVMDLVVGVHGLRLAGAKDPRDARKVSQQCARGCV
jgi:hypothetical protein